MKLGQRLCTENVNDLMMLLAWSGLLCMKLFPYCCFMFVLVVNDLIRSHFFFFSLSDWTRLGIFRIFVKFDKAVKSDGVLLNKLQKKCCQLCWIILSIHRFHSKIHQFRDETCVEQMTKPNDRAFHSYHQMHIITYLLL